MMTAANDQLSVLSAPPTNTRLIATVSETGSVDIKVATGRVRVETALVAMPTSAIAKVATARLCLSEVKSVKSGNSDQAVQYLQKAIKEFPDFGQAQDALKKLQPASGTE